MNSCGVEAHTRPFCHHVEPNIRGRILFLDPMLKDLTRTPPSPSSTRTDRLPEPLSKDSSGLIRSGSWAAVEHRPRYRADQDRVLK